jgi:xylulokinase
MPDVDAQPTSIVLGLDIGTSACKAVLVAESGELVAEASHAYPTQRPQPLWSEQNPSDWYAAAIASVRELMQRAAILPRQVLAIGLTGQMHGLVLLDARGEPLRPAILWNDQRTEPQCRALTERVGGPRVLRLTGNPILTGFTAPKIAWVRENEPQHLRAATACLLPKDYVRYRLTGAFHSDVSDASGTSLFDVERRCWSDEMIDAVGVPRAWLPQVFESPEISSHLSTDAAAAMGLLPGTPVCAGAGDQAAQAVGSGIVECGVVSVTVGTSGVVFAPTDAFRPDRDGRLHAFCHAVPGMWHQMGVMLSAGGSLEWLSGVLAETDSPERLAALAATAPRGCEGLLFLPYLSGERTPHADPRARGVFFGLTPRHGKAHLARSVLEGVAYGLRDSLELISASGPPIERIRISGGGASSPVWRQILADVLGKPLDALTTTAGAAFGAALLAGVGVGMFTDVRAACRRAVKIGAATLPEPAVEYDEGYRRYRRLYPALAAEFREIG